MAGPPLGGVTHIVAVGPDEAVEVRAVMRRPASERWSREELQAIRVVPWVWKAAAAPGADEVQVLPHVAPDPELHPPGSGGGFSDSLARANHASPPGGAWVYSRLPPLHPCEDGQVGPRGTPHRSLPGTF